MRRRSTSALVSCAIDVARSGAVLFTVDVLVLCYSQIDVMVLCYSRTNPTPRQPQELSSVDCVAPSSR